MAQNKYITYEKLKITSSSGIYKTNVIVVVMYCYLERENC